MVIKKCKICSNEFYVKPAHLKKGWGIYCSIKCKGLGSQNRKLLNCFVCGELTSKTLSQIKHSVSGKYFCSKTCQSIWRNVEYSGDRHSGWRGGMTTYRKILLKSSAKAICSMCMKTDFRVLVVHHIDHDHSNMKKENLVWLCHNCHYLVHHDKLEKQRFEDVVKPK